MLNASGADSFYYLFLDYCLHKRVTYVFLFQQYTVSSGFHKFLLCELYQS